MEITLEAYTAIQKLSKLCTKNKTDRLTSLECIDFRFDQESGTLTATASDLHRMAQVTVPAKGDFSCEFTCKIPPRAFKPGETDRIEIQPNLRSGYVNWKIDSYWQENTEICDEDYPSVSRHMKEDGDVIEFQVDAKYLIDVLQAVDKGYITFRLSKEEAGSRAYTKATISKLDSIVGRYRAVVMGMSDD